MSGNTAAISVHRLHGAKTDDNENSNYTPTRHETDSGDDGQQTRQLEKATGIEGSIE